MASGTTLRFSVEVAADQAQEALKAMTLAFDQAGVKAKSSLTGMAGAAKHAKSGLEILKKEMGQARNTAMYFTQAIGEIGPQGKLAQTAISGIAGAIMTGGTAAGLLLALTAATAAVGYLKDAWEAEAKAAEEAKTKNIAAARDIADSAVNSANALKLKADEAYHGEAKVAAAKFQRDMIAINAKIADARKRSGDDVQSEEVKALVAERNRLVAAMREEAAARATLANIAQTEASANQWAEAEKVRVKAAQDRAEKIQALGAAANAQAWKWQEEEAARLQKSEEERDKAGAAANAQAWKWQEEEATRLERASQLAEDGIKKQAASAEQMGATYGAILGNVITGQMTVAEGFAAIGQQIIATVVQTAIASITADAARAAAAAGASQAGIPVIGPVLAVSAMGAMLSAVLGMIGNVGASAAGGFDVGNFAPVTQLHPREMVLPAHLAERVRGMTSDGGSAVNLTIVAWDGKDVRRVLLDNDAALAEAISKARRKGRFS